MAKNFHLLNFFFWLISSFFIFAEDRFIEKIQMSEFDLLMQKNRGGTEKYFSQEDLENLDFFRKSYLAKYSLISEAGASKIPQILHFIWLGPRPLPAESVQNIVAWKKHHPTWTVKFWTDLEERPLPVPGIEKQLVGQFEWSYLKDFFDQSTNWGEKSDLLRYEILFKEGGIYVDHDIDCYAPFAPLTKFHLFACLEPPHYNPGISTAIFTTNALIGSVPFHPILKETMKKIQSKWASVGKKYPGQLNTFNRVLNRTFVSFSEAIKEGLDEKEFTNIVLPTTFLYPYPHLTKEDLQILIDKNLSYGFHQTAGSWLK